MLSLKRAQEVKNVFLNDIEESRTIPGRLVQPFFEFYNQEFKPGAFASMPCTCSPKTWIQMVEEVKNEVNKVLSAAAGDAEAELYKLSKAEVDEPKPEPVKKKKVTAAAQEDNTK